MVEEVTDFFFLPPPTLLRDDDDDKDDNDNNGPTAALAADPDTFGTPELVDDGREAGAGVVVIDEIDCR